MIAPINWLWKQLRGPQISAIMRAIFDYFMETVDPLLEYWNNMDIVHANTQHLTIIGALQGIARPILYVPSVDYFWFSDVPEEGTYYPSEPYTQSLHGLSTIEDMSKGGKFAEIEEDTSEGSYKIIGNSVFRPLLQGASKSMAAQGSLEWLDDVLYELWRTVQPFAEPTYTFTILDAEAASGANRIPGDVKVNLGNALDWGTQLFADLVAEINLLGTTIYYPVPTLYTTAII